MKAYIAYKLKKSQTTKFRGKNNKKFKIKH